MTRSVQLLLVLDLTGVFAFALNGALTALKAARLDLVGVLTLAMITALGGGIIRDVVLGATPPATFADARYLAVAAAGGLLAFLLGHRLDRLAGPIIVLDASVCAAAAVCFAVRMAGVRWDLHAPMPPGAHRQLD